MCMSNKKIVIIGNVASMLINFRKELILELIRKGYQVYCFAYGYTEKEKQTVMSWGAIPRDHYLNLNGVNPLSDLKGVYKLVCDLKEIKPDVVFNTFIKPVIFGTFAARLAKVPKLIGMIEGLGNAFILFPKGKKFSKRMIKLIQIILYRFSIPLLNHIILLNPDDKKDLIDKYSIRSRKLTILGGIGVDLKRFSYIEPAIDKPINFIFIGRLLREKGIFEFLEAAKVVRKLCNNVHFTVLGAFDRNNPFSLPKDSLDNYIYSGIVEYLGYVENVSEVIAQSSVFVLPSYREGVPRSTQEAMAIGRAIITTDVPGCRETVEEGVNGFLISPYSSEKIAEKMFYFIQNPEQIVLMGKESRRIAEQKFDVDKITKNLISIIESNSVE